MAIDNNADFTPTIPDAVVVPTKLPYNPTGSFKFWAQKVIPLVYDDSLSYYEVLCKVVTYLNNVIQNVDNLNDSVDNTNNSFETLESYVNSTKNALLNTYEELEGYVNTYFDNLDVQSEINQKLDEMAESGALSNLLAPFIPDLVTDWLNENVTPVGSAVVVDNSLTIAGAAADAKVTGDRLKDVEGDLDQLVILDTLSVTWMQGTINGSTGGPSSSSTRCRTDGYLQAISDNGIRIVVPSSYKVYVYVYSSQSTDGYEGAYSAGWLTGTQDIFPGKNKYIRVVCSYTDDSAITPSDITGVVFSTRYMTDTTLSLSGKIADAKTTGDFINTSYALEVGTRAVQIPSNSDLNNYTTAGNYRAVSNAIVSTLSNIPVSVPFKLTVECLTTTSQVKQTLSDIENRTYERRYSNGSWSSWSRIFKSLEGGRVDDVTVMMRAALLRDNVIHLGKGTFVIHELQMPPNSILVGQGNDTVLTLSDSYPTTYALKMSYGCSLRNLKIVGTGGTDYSANGTITDSHGILINGGGNSADTRNRIHITDVEVCGFTGGGICMKNTGYNYDDSASIVNCYFHHNNVGIYIPVSAEYNRISNVSCANNYYGCINNGGNNVFVGCGFNGNTQALLMDNTDGTADNNSHGSFVGCTFNHSGSNQGKAIEIISMAAGEVFSACQIFYGTIHLTNAKGVQFNGCNFGTNSGIFADGGANLMIGCMQINRSNTPITLSNGAVFHAINCYNREGTLYTDFP